MSRARVILDDTPPGGYSPTLWRCPLVFVPVTRREVRGYHGGYGHGIPKDTIVTGCVENTMAAARVCVQDLVANGSWPKNSLTATAAYDCTLRARFP